MTELFEDSKSEFTAKYSRLILDYKSLREKYNILKSAVINEREKTKSSENSLLDSGIQSRKLTQEVDSLKFRNELLTRQINTLREELDFERQKKMRKNSLLNKDSKESNEPLEVLRDELMSKINECSNLHSKVSNLKFEHLSESNNYRSAINDLENQLKLMKEQKDIIESNLRKTLAHEMEDRSGLENKLESKDQVIFKLRQSEQSLLKDITELKEQLISVNEPGLPLREYNLAKSDERLNDDIKSCDESTQSNHLLFNSNDSYTCSLIEKITTLEKKLNVLELKNEILAKRYNGEKMFRERYEQFFSTEGLELPTESGLNKKQEKSSEIFDSSDKMLSRFYEEKIQNLTKVLHQAIARTTIYYDELKISESRMEWENIDKSLIRTENENLKQKILSIQEDLELTRSQYEDKLKDMSIYLAEMSSQLEIDNSNKDKNNFLGTNQSNKVSSFKLF